MSVTTHDMIEGLKKADDAYYNSTPIMSDAEYDNLYKTVKKFMPEHVYFTGVGSEVRGGKIDLPYQMGSLNQVYDGEIEGWVKKHNLENEFVALTDKLDGTSAMIVYDANGDLQIAFSRGDGVQGADITRHIKRLPTVPNKISGSGVVRGEVIISKENFVTVQANFSRHGSDSAYKNARNAVAGIMNRKDNDPDIYQYVHFIAYQVVGEHDLSYADMRNKLQTEGFRTPHQYVVQGHKLTDANLTNILEGRRGTGTAYEIDGLVLDVDGAAKRAAMNPTKDTLNPAYAVKFKVADASNLAVATVIKVEWNVSKHGYLKPRVHIEPTELVGVTIQHATGFNARFIFENMIGPGAQVQITRSGDVIPFIQKVTKPMPMENM